MPANPPLHHNRTFLGRRWARLLMWMVSSHVAVAIGPTFAGAISLGCQRAARASRDRSKSSIDTA